METEEQRIDREFDELNEGIMATQIIEWFEKEHPEPKWTGAEEETTEQFVEEWNIWQRELVLYAAGWKDALRELKWRSQWIKDAKWVEYFLQWFRCNAETILWWRRENMLDEENIMYLRDCEGVEGVLWCEMLPVDIDGEDWDYREPR